MECANILAELRELADHEAVAGMARFGISSRNTLGVSIPALRKIASRLGRNHDLAQRLWASSIHEARILAGLIDDPRMISSEQMDLWTYEFDSWDVTDQVCSNLFAATTLARQKCLEWSAAEPEFVKRAGFTLMACLAVKDKQAADAIFEEFFPIIRRESLDGRNYVKKAVNWALRQIGKRNLHLNQVAIRTGEEIRQLDSGSARWIAADALRELASEAVQRRLST